MENLNIPRKREFTWPVWGNDGEMLLSIKDITGALSMWAVKQSPYSCPEKIEEAVEALGKRLATDLEFSEIFTRITIENLRQYLCETFEKLPEIARWNEPKIQTGALFQGSCSMYHTAKPDYDFIDLGALARNVAHTCGMEYFYWQS